MWRSSLQGNVSHVASGRVAQQKWKSKWSLINENKLHIHTSWRTMTFTPAQASNSPRFRRKSQLTLSIPPYMLKGKHCLSDLLSEKILKRNIHKFVTFFLFTPCNIKGNNYLCSRMIQGRFYKLDGDSVCRSYRCALHSVTLWLLLCLVGTKTSGTIGTNPSLANLWTLPI